MKICGFQKLAPCSEQSHPLRNLQTSHWNLTRPIFFQLSSTYETLALSVFSLLIHVSRCSPFHPFTFSLVHRFTYSPFHLGEKVKGGKPGKKGFQKLAPCTEESYPLRNLETSQWNLTRLVPCKQGGRILPFRQNCHPSILPPPPKLPSKYPPLPPKLPSKYPPLPPKLPSKYPPTSA